MPYLSCLFWQICLVTKQSHCIGNNLKTLFTSWINRQNDWKAGETGGVGSHKVLQHLPLLFGFYITENWMSEEPVYMTITGWLQVMNVTLITTIHPENLLHPPSLTPHSEACRHEVSVQPSRPWVNLSCGHSSQASCWRWWSGCAWGRCSCCVVGGSVEPVGLWWAWGTSASHCCDSHFLDNKIDVKI